jgi:hypothetical protein
MSELTLSRLADLNAARPLVGPPLPKALDEQLRWAHTGLRYRMLYGLHRQDIEAHVVAAVGQIRAMAWRPLDLSSNPFALAYEQSAALYHDEPAIVGPDPYVIAAVADSGVWPLMQRQQRDVMALREGLMLCELDDDGQPRAHVILPHRAEVEVDPRRPGRVVAVHWWELAPGSLSEWVRYHIDPRLQDEGYWVTDRQGKDITEEIRDGSTGYPWRGPDGTYLQPVIMQHAAETGQTWDPYTKRETVEGTIHLALHYTHLGHLIRHAAHSQRYTVGARPRGVDLGDEEHGQQNTQQVIADAANVIQMEPDEDAPAGSVQIGQWAATMDPEKLMGAIRAYERRLIEQAVGGVEVTRGTSDIRSGASLAIGREAQILAQERCAPVFRMADRRALQLWSAQLATYTGRDLAQTWPTTTGQLWGTSTGATRPMRDIEYHIGSAGQKITQVEPAHTEDHDNGR